MLPEDAQGSYLKCNYITHFICFKNHQYGVLVEFFSCCLQFPVNSHPQSLKDKGLQAFNPCYVQVEQSQSGAELGCSWIKGARLQPSQLSCSPHNCWTTLSEQVCMQHSFRRLIFCSLLQMCFILLSLLFHSQPRGDPFPIISHSSRITWQKYHSPAISGFAFVFSSEDTFRVSVFWKPWRFVGFFLPKKGMSHTANR